VQTLIKLEIKISNIEFPALEAYFGVVVASLICKFHEKPKECKADIEVLSSESEEL